MKQKTIAKVVLINTQEILPNPAQPRVIFAQDELDELACSIRENGIIQPLTVRQDNGGRYELVAGERRLRAAKIAGLTQVPCIVTEMDKQSSAIVAILENIQRSNLNFFEQAVAIQNLIKEWNVSQDEAAARLGKAKSTLSNHLRILKLSPVCREIILKNNLTERHARALLILDSDEKQRFAANYIAANNLNVSQSEKYINALCTPVAMVKKVKSAPMVKDVRLFLNTINKAIDVMKNSGINAVSEKKEENNYIEYVVRIPLQK